MHTRQNQAKTHTQEVRPGGHAPDALFPIAPVGFPAGAPKRPSVCLYDSCISSYIIIPVGVAVEVRAHVSKDNGWHLWLGICPSGFDAPLVESPGKVPGYSLGPLRRVFQGR